MQTADQKATLDTIAEAFQFTPKQREVLGISRSTRRPAKCRNSVGSALRPEGACTTPAIRVVEVGGTRRYNLCGKCAEVEAPYLAPRISDGHITVTPIA